MANGTYQHNYKSELAGTGREIRIADEVMGYYYDLAEGDTLIEALEDFADSYDYADSGERSIVVHLTAEEYQDGEIVMRASAKMTPLGGVDYAQCA